jgi:anthranilate/para-aminobenzoate synthase component I
MKSPSSSLGIAALATKVRLNSFDPVAIIRELGLEGSAPVVLLDSAGGSPALARRHYLVWRPALWVRAKDGQVRRTESLPGEGQSAAPEGTQPFDAVHAAAAAAQAALAAAPFPESRSLFGLVAYDAVRYLEELPDSTRDDLRLPDIDLFLPTRMVRFDIGSGVADIVCWPLAEAPGPHAWPLPQGGSAAAAAMSVEAAAAARADLSRIAAVLQTEPHTAEPYTDTAPTGCTDAPVYRSNYQRVHYENIVGRTREYVFAGDIFQANLSQRLELLYALPSLHLYDTLRRVNPSPFAGYLAFGDYELISSSPERLVELAPDGWAQTRPIAGTRPRGQHDAEALDDGTMTEELNLDPKDRAEHVMLVDLERNDLGKVCDYGTVRVSELMVNEYYSHVIHIVSNVRGRLHPRRNGVDLLKGMFPGGTITGCPKVRCMEIIDELETVRRGPYTGSFGWLSLDTLDMNIVIRTLVRVGDRLFLQVGGGIVADSVPEKEYLETLHKARGMLRAVAASVAERPR